jgi:hypothetical protein
MERTVYIFCWLMKNLWTSTKYVRGVLGTHSLRKKVLKYIKGRMNYNCPLRRLKLRDTMWKF